MKEFCFEGKLLKTAANAAATASLFALEEAMHRQSVLEGICYLCDAQQNLHVKLGKIEGIIPKSEGALGIEEGKIKDIALISKVGKPVQFVIKKFEQGQTAPVAILSRRQVQQRCYDSYISRLRPGDIVEARVTHLEKFGAFVDIGAGINSLIPIDMLSVSRISHPRQRLRQGDVIRSVIKNMQAGKITLSLRELLGTWEENAAHFAAGQTVKGIIRGIESYGIFIELAPNLAGLAEYSEGLFEGQEVSVYIKAILPAKMKIKLTIIDRFGEAAPTVTEYYYHGAHMARWRYNPLACNKVIESVFE